MNEFGKTQAMPGETAPQNYGTQRLDVREEKEMLDLGAQKADYYFQLYQEDSDNPEIPRPQDMSEPVRMRFEALILEFHAINHLERCINEDKYVWPRDAQVRDMLRNMLWTERQQELLDEFEREEIKQAKANQKPIEAKPDTLIAINKLSPEAQNIAFSVIEATLQSDPEFVHQVDPEFLKAYAGKLIDDIQNSRRPVEMGNLFIHKELQKVMIQVLLERQKNAQMPLAKAA